MPLYLRETINSYLSNRYIAYNIEDGAAVNWRMSTGVSQGSVLGPLLWNVSFIHVMEAAVPVGVQIVCYDTLLIASGKSWNRILRIMAVITTRIQNLGLNSLRPKPKLYGFTAFPDHGNPLLHDFTYKGNASKSVRN